MAIYGLITHTKNIKELCSFSTTQQHLLQTQSPAMRDQASFEVDSITDSHPGPCCTSV